MRTNRYGRVFLLLTTTPRINEIEEQPNNNYLQNTTDPTQTPDFFSVTDDGGATTDGSSSRLRRFSKEKKIPILLLFPSHAEIPVRVMSRAYTNLNLLTPVFHALLHLSLSIQKQPRNQGACHSLHRGQTSIPKRAFRQLDREKVKPKPR